MNRLAVNPTVVNLTAAEHLRLNATGAGRRMGTVLRSLCLAAVCVTVIMAATEPRTTAANFFQDPPAGGSKAKAANEKGPVAAPEPLVAPFLYAGDLTGGAAAMEARLKTAPKDDQARIGLGVVRFLQAFEHVLDSLYVYGLRSERAFRGVAELREFVPQNPNPKEVSYDNFREILQTWVNDLTAAEAALAAVTDPNVQLPLLVGRIRLRVPGVAEPVGAKFVLGRSAPNVPPELIDSFVVGFDRGDVTWLRGYVHLLAAWGEILLAIDGKEPFERVGHLFFEKPVTPHKFLLEEPRELSSVMRFDTRSISDILAFLHLWRFPVREPHRLKSALQHLETTLAMSREMWTHFNAETDDANEWIPNPKQTGVLNVTVTEEMQQAWLKTVTEAEAVLQGKTLLPFWRGNPSATRGVNLRRVFLEPSDLDPFFWVQGTAATKYLEDGKLTPLANREFTEEISAPFGPGGMWFFSLWFN